MRSESRLRVAMGTWVAVEGRHERAAALFSAIDAGFAAIQEVERLMHPSRAGSDVAQINQARPGTCLRIDPRTWYVLRLARELGEMSDGAFDPCLPSQPGRISDVELIAPGEVVCHAQVAIDLGGIAKGYA